MLKKRPGKVELQQKLGTANLERRGTYKSKSRNLGQLEILQPAKSAQIKSGKVLDSARWGLQEKHCGECLTQAHGLQKGKKSAKSDVAT